MYKILILISVLLWSCSDENDNQTENGSYLKLVAEYGLSVEEPSGLSLSYDGNHLWTVSDKSNKVYKMSLAGSVLKELTYRGNDLEGIVQSTLDSTLWIVEEYVSYMIQLDTLGTVLDSVLISAAGGSNGLEGITINSQNNHFFLLKEQKPGVLIELNEQFERLRYKRIGFAADFSGITYEPINQHLWIVSDESEKVFECDLDANIIREFEISVDKAEGIAVDLEKDLVYIVSDSYDRLYHFSIKN